MKPSTLAAGVALLAAHTFAGAPAARAQPATAGTDDAPAAAPAATPDTAPGVTAPRHESAGPRSGGLVASATGGLTGFSGGTMQRVSGAGGAWGLRLAARMHDMFALEAEYVGSAQPIRALGLDPRALLVGTGLDAALRVTVGEAGPLRPFLLAGLGWRHYSLARERFNTAAVAGGDDVLELPLGAGVAIRARGFVIDVRAELRPTRSEDLIPVIVPATGRTDHASMARWGLTASVGYEL